MRDGDFAAAWALSDRWLGVPQDLASTPRHLQRIWSGAAVHDRHVLIRCYHGLGDTIQFIRYVPMLAAVARSVAVWAQPVLLPLLGRMHGIGRLLPLHDGEPDVTYDVDLEIMELPHLFRTAPSTIPAGVPYLSAPISGALTTLQSGEDRRRPVRAGVMYRSGGWNTARDIPRQAVAPICRLPGLTTVALDPRLPEDDAHVFSELPRVSSIDELACVMASLDVVVSVDTMAAHLAGALGIPTILLLHESPDWRWMRDRTDTPWYPRTRLIRKDSGGWNPVVSRVEGELRRCLETTRGGHQPSTVPLAL